MILTLILASSSSCNSSLSEVCSTQLPTFNQRLESALALVHPITDSDPARSLASELTAPAVPETLNEEERSYWRTWAMTRLTETQKYLDITEGVASMRDARKILALMGNDFVSLYGFAEKSNQRKVASLLETLHAQGQKVAQTACNR
jgi:hypothetical protein